MGNFTQEINEILTERFGKDTLISIATVEDGIPYVRNVNAFYKDGVFYVITYALSNKMRHIEKGSPVAISGEWFTGHGKGINLGWFRLEKNKKIAVELEEAFMSWINNGHSNFDDENTIILEIKLTDAVIFSHGRRFDVTF